MAIIFALCSLGCSAVNDFIFKLFADRPMSRGVFFSIIGVIITLTMVFTVDFKAFEANLTNTLIWGCAAGFFSIAGNVLLIEAMGKLSAGICSTIYRLNLIFVVPGAILFFGEKLSLMQLCGVTAAVLAILLFSCSTMSGERKVQLFRARIKVKIPPVESKEIEVYFTPSKHMLNREYQVLLNVGIIKG